MEIYSHFGYHIKTTATKGDQGVDLIMTKGDEKIAVQCKRYRNNVNNKAVQEVFAGMHYYGCNKAMVITTSTFTYGARKLAKALSVELIDCDDLSYILSSNNNYFGENFYKSQQLTQILINAGADLFQYGQYYEAIELLTTIISYKDKFLPENINDLLNAYNYLALCYSRIGNYSLSERTYLEGLKIKDYFDLKNNLAVLYRETGRYIEAKKILDDISIEPNSFSYQSVQRQREDLTRLIELNEQLQNGQISRSEYERLEKDILKKYR